MIRLVYSDRAERLADALIANIEEAKRIKRRSALDPVDILIPNRATPAWLKLYIAKKTGIAANLRFDSLERFLTNAVEKAPAKRRPGVRVANVHVFQAAILGVMLDPKAIGDPALAQVRAYIEPPGEHTDEDTADVRRIQLSHQLAKLFDEYVYSRRDMLRAWSDRPTIEQPRFAELERWQRALYLRVIAALRASKSAEVMTLPDAFEHFDDLSREVHVFAVRITSPILMSLLHRMARSAEVFLYALNPVKEFWDDLDVQETPALRLWGRAGRENIRLLNELTEGDFDDRFSDGPAASTLLGELSRDIFLRRPERTSVEVTERRPDPSITLLPCPGARREIEVIAGEIWNLVRGPGALKFNEIALVIAGRDRELYRAHAGAVFHETYAIPHHFIDVPMRGTSRVLEAVELLLALPFSRFTRQDLLRLVLHPSVRAMLGNVDPGDWLRWLDALTVVHGADHSDHANTYIEKDLYNWDQGLRRLVLGAFLSGSRSGDTRIFELDGQHYLPEEASLDRLGSVARMVTLVRSLVADARFVRGAKMPLADWAEMIAHLVTSYVGRAGEEDERDLLRCLSVIHDLARAESLPGQAERAASEASGEAGRRIHSADNRPGPVSFRIASELVLAGLSRLTVNRGQALADGVSIGTLSSLSFLPFRAVFIAGLGEGQFPGSDRRSQLDLRTAERRKGDVTPREEDEYLFLERVLATGERLYLSWVSREARTGDPLAPSSIVLELQQMLERGYEASPVLDPRPLRRYDDERSLSLSARSERAVLELRKSFEAVLDGGDRRIPELARLRREMEPRSYSALAKRLELPELPPISAEGASSTIQVPYGALRRFLEDPCEGWMRYVLRLRENDQLEDPLAREDEAFSAGALEATILLREVFAEKLGLEARGVEVSFAELYDRRALDLELRGVLPTGVFGRADRERHLALLESWKTTVARIAPPGASLQDSVRFGRAQENVAAKESLDPLVIELTLPPGRRLRVELHGRTEISLAGTVVLPFMRQAGGEITGEKDALRGFLDHLVFTIIGKSGRRGVFVLYSAGEPFRIDFEAIVRDEAEAYLRSLLVDLLSETHAYHLPFEEVIGEPRESAALPRLPRLPADARRAVEERRFGLYFKLRRTRT